MPAVLDPSRRQVVVALFSTVLAACNAIVGIDEPLGIPLPDAGFEWDAPPVETDAPSSPRDRGSDGAGASPDGTNIVDGSTVQDVAPGADRSTVSDVVGASDVPRPPDATAQDRTGAPIADGGSNPPFSDVRDGGALAPPGFATASCTFSAIAGANADSSPYSSTQGDAKRKSTATDETIDLNLTNFVRGVQRTLIIRLQGPVTAGKTIVLDDRNFVEYYDVKTGYGWGSTFASNRGGMVKVEEVNGASFSFTMSKIQMGAHANMAGSLGSFTLDGYGTAHPQ